MGFSAIDYIVLLAYLAGITAFGVMFRKSQRTVKEDRKSTRLNSSHGYISYAVFCLKKKNTHSRILYEPKRPATSTLLPRHLACARIIHCARPGRCPSNIAIRHPVRLSNCTAYVDIA